MLLLAFLFMQDPVEPEITPDIATIADLCEPYDSRRPYPTSSEKAATIDLIEATCKAMGVDKPSCRFFSHVVSLRESSYRPWVRHKMAGDVAAASRAYLGSGSRYGWDVFWRARDRKQENLQALELRPREEPNPYFVTAERWMSGGLGLGGLNVPFHLAKFDPMAPPEILCDPVINVMVQISLARNAVDRYGARNWYEVQAVYAGRTFYDRKGRHRPLTCSGGCPDAPDAEDKLDKARKGDADLRKRCSVAELDCKAKPVLGTTLRHRATPAERYTLAEKLRGAPLPAWDVPEATVTVLPADTP